MIPCESVVTGSVRAVAFTLLELEKMSKFLDFRHHGWLEYLSVSCHAGNHAL
jgi:hypothetical protein